MRILLLAALIALTGCDATLQKMREVTNTSQRPAPTPSPDSISQDQRFKEYVIPTKQKADFGYRKAKQWAALAFGNAKEAIQLDEPASHHFLAHGRIEDCRMSDYVKVRDITFVVDFQAKDNRVRLLFDHISATGPETRWRGDVQEGIYPRTKTELDQFAENCLDGLKDDLVTQISTEKGSKNW